MTAKTLVSLVFAAMLTAGTSSVFAQTEVRMTGFGGATNLPVWVAIDKGFFGKEGLKVTLDQTTGSEAQVKDVMAGKYQFMSFAFDNIVAYIEGQGATKFDNMDLIAIMGVHSGLNSVLARPEIKSYADVKGKTVAVDAVTSGYSTVLYDILQKKAGLARDKDYTVAAVGGTEARMKALEEGTAAVAIISTPADLQARKKGFNVIGDATQEVGAYQGSIYAVRRSWAKDHESEVSAFIRGIVGATEFIFANKAGAIEVLKARTKALSDGELGQIYDRIVGPGGLNRGAMVNMPGVETVLKLRAIYGDAKSGEPAKYVDLSYYEKATGKK
jgi:ABC-type nitrate/sulfonate/bicarbonate transport system substrate-binding protein